MSIYGIIILFGLIKFNIVEISYHALITSSLIGYFIISICELYVFFIVKDWEGREKRKHIREMITSIIMFIFFLVIIYTLLSLILLLVQK